MPEATKNENANVSAAKGVKGGYLFRAPLGSNKPTDLKTQLDAAFKVLGFVSEDGIVFSTESDTEDLKDMNGDIMDSAQSSYKETFTATLAEVKKGVLDVLYGSKNVTDATGLLTVHVKGDQLEHGIYVFEGVLKNGRRMRRLIHDAKVTELGDLALTAGELYAREATFTAYLDAESGDYYTDYYDSTETTGA